MYTYRYLSPFNIYCQFANFNSYLLLAMSINYRTVDFDMRIKGLIIDTWGGGPSHIKGRGCSCWEIQNEPLKGTNLGAA